MSYELVVIGGGRDAHPVRQPDGSYQFARLRDYVGRGVITTGSRSTPDS